MATLQKWFGHLLRIDSNGISKIIYGNHPMGGKMNRRHPEAEMVAQDRTLWGNVISQADGR